MESTGKYWIPVFNLLEDEINVVIANPKWVKVAMNIENKMKEEMNWMKHYFEKNFKFEDIKPKLIFIIFPIENIEALRGNEGFYAGLC